MALAYVWRRGDAVGAEIAYTAGGETGPEHLQVEVTPQPLSRVVRLVAGVAASYHQRAQSTSSLMGSPAVGYFTITLENSAAPVGYPKTVHEQVCAMHTSITQVVPIPVAAPYPLPDMHTVWTSDVDTVDTRRSDFNRGEDPEGSPSYALNFTVFGIPSVLEPAGVKQAWASWRVFMKVLCEVGTPD